MYKGVYNKRVENKLEHLFDSSLWNVYNDNYINLSVGAPGTDLLSRCCAMFERATEHRMVNIVLIYDLTASGFKWNEYRMNGR